MLSLVIPSSSLHDQEPSRCIPPRDRSYSLSNLVKDIKSYLGKDSGIDSSTIDEEYLKSLFRKYTSNPNDWFRYFYNDYSKNYTRNTIENINRKANIVSDIYNNKQKKRERSNSGISSSSCGIPAKVRQSTTMPTPTASWKSLPASWSRQSMKTRTKTLRKPALWWWNQKADTKPTMWRISPTTLACIGFTTQAQTKSRCLCTVRYLPHTYMCSLLLTNCHQYTHLPTQPIMATTSSTQPRAGPVSCRRLDLSWRLMSRMPIEKRRV